MYQLNSAVNLNVKVDGIILLFILGEPLSCRLLPVSAGELKFIKIIAIQSLSHHDLSLEMCDCIYSLKSTPQRGYAKVEQISMKIQNNIESIVEIEYIGMEETFRAK